MGLLEQTTQLRSSRTYDDTFSPGASLETPGAGSEHMEFDLNAIRSMLMRHNDGAGAGNWFDALLDGFGLKQIHDKILAFDMPPLPGTQDFVLGAAASGALIPATLLVGGAGTVAVGPASTEDGGYVAADEANFTVAGTLGVGLSTASDGDGVLLNRCSILDADTNDHPDTPAGEQIFGLLQVISGSADGVAIAGVGSENLQMSFVYIDKVTDIITATTLPAGTYHFSLPRQRNFYGLNRGALLSGGALPSIIDPGSSSPRLPFKEFDITAGAIIAAGDPLNINTGAFTTAGARTTLVASYGTIALPASGAEFRDDERIIIDRNGRQESRGVGAGTPRDAYWVSATQIAFNHVLFSGETLYLRMPSAY